MRDKKQIIKILFMSLIIILTAVILNNYSKLRSNNINGESKEVFKEAAINIKNNLFKTLNSNKDITISAVGDIIVHDEQIQSAYNKDDKKYNFEENFSVVKDYLNKSNFTYASIEGTYSGKELGEYTGYPIYNSPEAMLQAIKEVGIDLIALNSEHILDKGVEGIINTINNCNSNKLDYTGVKHNKESKNFILKNINGINLGITSFVFESPQNNGKRTLNDKKIPEEADDLINTFGYETLDEDLEKIKNTINNMKNEGADFIIVGMHWGIEYDKNPSKYQKKLAKELNNYGVDLVLGSHPHVIQPIEKIKNEQGKETIVAYSMGNFLSNQSKETIGKAETADGVILEFTIGENDNKDIVVKDYKIIPTWVYKYKDKNEDIKYKILSTEDTLKSEEAKNKLSEEVLKKIKKSEETTKNILKENTE